MTVTRFAPSPTGFLHLGHAYAACNAWVRARRANGRFLLRIEDIDPTRCRPDYTAAILEDLHWLGLDWDGDVRVQSEQLNDYQNSLSRLEARGLLYPCFCTRGDIAREVAQSATAPHDPAGMPLYPGTCRTMPLTARMERIAAGIPHAMRLDMHRALATLSTPLFYNEEGHGSIRCAPEQFGDVVLARKDAPASYHLCVTHDDALQGVTLVTRGVDLQPVTDLHRLIQVLMGWPAPDYAHHQLLTDQQGRRLAKRDHAQTLRELARNGAHPMDIWRAVGVVP